MQIRKLTQGRPRVSLRPHQSLAHATGNYRAYFVAGGTIYLDIGESKMMRARALGRYELKKMNLVRNWLEPGATFVDVGSTRETLRSWRRKSWAVTVTSCPSSPSPNEHPPVKSLPTEAGSKARIIGPR
jgi:hypothetical protein